MKKVINIIFILLVFAALIFDIENMALSVAGAVETCLYVIIPSLFGFMVMASYLIKSGLYRIFLKPLFILLRCVFNLSEREFGIFILSLFGGYPVGAKLLTENNGDTASSVRNASRLLSFCYCPGPGFVISVVGIGLFSNSRVGFAVYLSNLLACIAMAVVHGFLYKKSPDRPQSGDFNPPLQLNQDVFTSSIISAASSLFPVCAVITAFGVITGAMRFYGLSHPLLLSALEISNITALTPGLSLLPLIAALFSFGGVCIIMQIPAVVKRSFPLRVFFILRIPAAALSALICKLTLPLWNFDIAVTASTNPSALITQAPNPIASVSLLIMSMMLVQMANDKRTTS